MYIIVLKENSDLFKWELVNRNAHKDMVKMGYVNNDAIMVLMLRTNLDFVYLNVIKDIFLISHNEFVISVKGIAKLVYKKIFANYVI